MDSGAKRRDQGCVGPSSVTVEQEEGQGPEGQVKEASFIYSTFFHCPPDTGAPRGLGERVLCLCIQAFQGLLQKVGAPRALKGPFVTGSLA